MTKWRYTKRLLCSLLLAMTHTAWAEDCVVLLHGLGSVPLAMKPLAFSLDVQPEYRVVNQGYNSYSNDLQALALETLPAAIRACNMRDEEAIHFVTHSMGGIMLRAFLAKKELQQLGRVVMIAPPNKGSEIVDWVERYALLKPFLGPAGGNLGTGEQHISAQLPAPEFVFGVIAGVRQSTSVWSSQLPGNDDGRVSTANTQIEQMADYIEIPGSHSGLLYKKQTIEQVTSFLRYGEFLRRSEFEPL